MKKYLVFIFVLASLVSYCQSSGSIIGNLIDKENNNEPLAFANVLVKGTDLTANSDIDGSYAINNLKPGNYELEFSFVGYRSEVLTIEVFANRKSKKDVILEANRPPSNIKIVYHNNTKETSSVSLN